MEALQTLCWIVLIFIIVYTMLYWTAFIFWGIESQFGTLFCIMALYLFGLAIPIAFYLICAVQGIIT